MYLEMYSAHSLLLWVAGSALFIGVFMFADVSLAPAPAFHQHQRNVSPAPAKRFISTTQTYDQHQRNVSPAPAFSMALKRPDGSPAPEGYWLTNRCSSIRSFTTFSTRASIISRTNSVSAPGRGAGRQVTVPLISKGPISRCTVNVVCVDFWGIGWWSRARAHSKILASAL